MNVENVLPIPLFLRVEIQGLKDVKETAHLVVCDWVLCARYSMKYLLYLL